MKKIKGYFPDIFLRDRRFIEIKKEYLPIGLRAGRNFWDSVNLSLSGCSLLRIVANLSGVAFGRRSGENSFEVPSKFQRSYQKVFEGYRTPQMEFRGQKQNEV